VNLCLLTLENRSTQARCGGTIRNYCVASYPHFTPRTSFTTRVSPMNSIDDLQMATAINKDI
jgi:hypothetical protein